jgi:thymidylate kinase
MEKIFEQEAQELLKIFTELKSGLSPEIWTRTKQRFHRPFIIEITGTPDSGKTSVISTLTRFFKRAGWRVLNPTEGAEIIKKVPRTTHLYNIRTGIYALSELLDNVYSLDFDLIIFDRAIFDAYCWQEYWWRKNIISKEVAEFNQKFFTQPEIANKIDICFFVVCQAEEALRREAKWALTDKHGETTNPETIKNLIKIWRDCFKKLKNDNQQIFLMDTTKMSPKQMGYFILKQTLKVIGKQLKKIKQG